MWLGRVIGNLISLRYGCFTIEERYVKGAGRVVRPWPHHPSGTLDRQQGHISSIQKPFKRPIRPPVEGKFRDAPAPSTGRLAVGENQKAGSYSLASKGSMST